jgi:hypothetical protein
VIESCGGFTVTEYWALVYSHFLALILCSAFCYFLDLNTVNLIFAQSLYLVFNCSAYQGNYTKSPVTLEYIHISSYWTSPLFYTLAVKGWLLGLCLLRLLTCKAYWTLPDGVLCAFLFARTICQDLVSCYAVYSPCGFLILNTECARIETSFCMIIGIFTFESHLPQVRSFGIHYVRISLLRGLFYR